MRKKERYFTVPEIVLFTSSVLLITVSFIIFKSTDYITLAASLIGAMSLIFAAKGNPLGMFLMIVFSILYGIISYGYSYYGEMITYLGMTAPMSAFSLITWLKNPYNGKKSEVAVNEISKKELIFMSLLTTAVTVFFYFVLKKLNTSNLIPSTISVITSFAAVYMTFRRSPLYALCYVANDVALIILWILASIENPSYFSVVVCFVMFLANDIYGFVNWQKMRKKQITAV